MPIYREDLPQGKGIKIVLKLSVSSSQSFADLIIGGVVVIPPPDRLFASSRCTGNA